MKVIFLDIDGVLCTTSCYGKGMNNKWSAYMFDQKAVVYLNHILNETGAEIILSSDWRHQYTLHEMREIFCHNGVLKGPIGFTPSLKTYIATNLEGGRADEIKLWIQNNAWKSDINWVAIDDLNMDEFLYPNFVHCPNEHEGIKRQGIRDKVINLLNGKLG